MLIGYLKRVCDTSIGTVGTAATIHILTLYTKEGNIVQLSVLLMMATAQ